jgi:putative transposase
VLQPPPKNEPRKPRWAIGRSVAQSADAASMNATGMAFNYLEYPTDSVLQVVFWRLRYKLSLRDLAEMFLQRGFVFTHEAVRD